MVMENTKMQPINHRTLSLNTVRFLFKQETVQATKYLNQHNIFFRILKSGEGYWLNVEWKCGITAPLTYQELSQLPEYQKFNQGGFNAKI